MKKILFITGSRGEYGYIKPIIKSIQKNNNFNFDVLTTNMHLLDTFGNTINEFQKDNIPVKYKIYNTLDGYNKLTMIKSIALFLLQIPEILEDSKPDILLISGDRGEQFMAAIAGLHLDIPIAHIQAGELSGHIDGVVRHSITKLTTIHFCSNQDAYERVIKLGENPDNIFLVGAPQIDDMLDYHLLDQNIKIKYGFNKDKLLLLLVYHSTQEEVINLKENISIIMDTIFSLLDYKNNNLEILTILPNSDDSNGEILNIYNNIKKNYNNIKFISSLPRIEYLSFLNICDVLVGNSSSGILEAATYKKPVINIGLRQNNRIFSKNVIQVKEYNFSKLKNAIEKGLSYKFKEDIKDVINLYGNDKSSPKILNILKDIDLNKLKVIKKIMY